MRYWNLARALLKRDWERISAGASSLIACGLVHHHLELV
jgi:hypothetical protein